MHPPTRFTFVCLFLFTIVCVSLQCCMLTRKHIVPESRKLLPKPQGCLAQQELKPLTPSCDHSCSSKTETIVEDQQLLSSLGVL